MLVGDSRSECPKVNSKRVTWAKRARERSNPRLGTRAWVRRGQFLTEYLHCRVNNLVFLF
jgi:hypothetical protein